MLRFKLLEIRPETEDVKTFIFKPLTPFTYQPGQYLDWQLPHKNADDRGERRWFSIASAPHEGNVWLASRFATEKSSTLKITLNQLKVGDEIEAKEPAGEFVVTDSNRPLVFLAGGIGITPFRAILMDLADKNELNNIVLLYGNRNQANVPYKTELDTLAKNNPGFTVKYIYSPNHIDEAVVREVCTDLSKPKFYVSGLEKMVNALHHMLESIGVPKENIKIDDFGGYDKELNEPVF